MTIKALVHDLNGGHGVVMEEGQRYHAQCDGKNHYLYKINKRAINPRTGKPYSKGRIYAGTFDGNRSKSPAYCSQWAAKHACNHGGTGPGSGRTANHDNEWGDPADAPIPVDWLPRASSRNT